MLSKINEYHLLNLIAGLPPKEYLSEITTECQLKHFKELKIDFSLLFASLQNYFTGDYNDLFDTLPKDKKETYILWRDLYLKLYGILHNCWGIINNTAKNYDIVIPVKTPGEYLIRIIQNDCRIMWNLCRYNSYYSPSRYFKEISDSRKLKQKGNELQRLKNYQKFLKETEYQENLGDLKNFVLAVANQKITKSMIEYRYLKEYKQTVSDIERLVLKIQHPNKRVKSIQWVEGNKYIK
jgi:hypothetical protein